MLKKQQNDFRSINFTGRPLSEDMLKDGAFESSDNVTLLIGDLSLKARIEFSINYLRNNEESFDYVIIKNDNFGVFLFDALYPEMKFLISCKKTNSEEHSYWQKLDRIKLNPQSSDTNFGAYPFRYSYLSDFI